MIKKSIGYRFLIPPAMSAFCFPVLNKDLLSSSNFIWACFWKPCCPVSWGLWHPNSVINSVSVFPFCSALNLGCFPIFCILVHRKIFRRFSEKCFPWRILCVSIPNKHTVLQKTFRIRIELFRTTRKIHGKRHTTGLAWASSYFPMLGKLIIHVGCVNKFHST